MSARPAADKCKPLYLSGVRQGPAGAAGQRGCEQDAVTALKAKQARRDATIMGSQAVLASVTALSDRLAPALAYAQAQQQQQQGQTGMRPTRRQGPGAAPRRATFLSVRNRDFSIGD